MAAAAIQIDSSHLCRLESGQHYPARATVEKLARGYSVTARTIWAAADVTALKQRAAVPRGR